MVLDVRCANGLSPACHCSCQSGEAGFSRSQCHKLDLYSHAFWPHQWAGYFHYFIHNINSIWKELPKQRGITIDDNMNTRIIVDDIVSWAKLVDSAPTCMEVNSRYARLIGYPSTYAKATSFRSGSSLWALMCVPTETVLHSPSTLFCKHGPFPKQSVTLPSSSALRSFTHNLFTTWKFRSQLYARSQSRSSLNLLHHTGRTLLRPH